jgi:hypothetical protein
MAIMVTFLYCILFFYASACTAAQEDYGQFIDIAKYSPGSSSPCHQDDAISFLQKERVIFNTTIRVAQTNFDHDELVRKACVNLYLATQVALQNKALEIGVKDPSMSCLKKTLDHCGSIIKNAELHAITSLSQSMAICLTLHAARRAEWRLYARSYVNKEKQE